jgi:hypothetical protein
MRMKPLQIKIKIITINNMIVKLKSLGELTTLLETRFSLAGCDFE